MHGRTPDQSLSMFERRLLLLAGGMAALVLGLSGAHVRLAVVQGADRRSEAQKRLDLVTFLPTERGRILDRKGRELAVNRPSYDVAVDYGAITGTWALEQATRAARREHEEWGALSPEARDAAVARHLPAHRARLDDLWKAVCELSGLGQAELDLRLDEIKADVQRTAGVVWENQLLRQEKEYGTAEEFAPRPILEQSRPHVVLPGVPVEVAFAFRRLEEKHPDLIRVQSSHGRVYPWHTADVTLDRSTLPQPLRSAEPMRIRVTGVADHILGAMRDETWAADIERRPFRGADQEIRDRGGYLVGDSVGARGLERTYEDHLRGLRGVVHERLDTGEATRTPHTPGRDLHLTLDIALQARVTAILAPEYGLTVPQQWQPAWNPDGSPRPTILPAGTSLPAAAVVLEVATGEILALVTWPTLAAAERFPEGLRERYQPMANRPVDAIYPPGSIIKPLALAAAVTEGVHAMNDPVECRGHYLPDRQDLLRCWVFRPPQFNAHGELRAAEALARSCNVYFYTVAEKVGFSRLVDWYGRFGLGRPIDVGLGLPVQDVSTWRGRLPDPSPGGADVGTWGSLRFATCSMGIGQGPVTWTPVHAANAYAALARRGEPRPVSLVRDDPRGSAGPVTGDLPLDARAVDAILEGLRQSIEEEFGTGHHIRYPGGRVEPIVNVPGVCVWAKTGTAEAPPPPFDLDGDGRPDAPRDDPSHAWFVGLVGPRGHGPPDPRYAVAVIVEYGGSGGRTAGPIANEIIRALIAEGYLRGTAP